MSELSFDPKPKGYLSPKQISEMHDEKKYLERQMTDPNIEDKGDVARLLRRLDTQVESQTPPKLTGEALDTAMAQRRELEAYIPVGMLSHEEMRKNVDGAVGHNMRWDQGKKNAVLAWKDLMRMTEWGNPDPDLANVECLRPQTSVLGMHSAQIQGQAYNFAPNTAEYRAKWDETFGEKTPEQILREHMDQGERLAAIESRLDSLVHNPGADDAPSDPAPEMIPEPAEADAAPRLGAGAA